MKTLLTARNPMGRIRVFLIATCPIAVTPRLSADIILLSRFSDATAFAAACHYIDPPPQTQTGFAPANLCNIASDPGCGIGGGGHNARADSASNSSISINNPIEGLRVVGDGTAHVFEYVGHAHASAKLIVLGFALTEVTYPYSITGQLNGASCEQSSACTMATAKLSGETGTIFEKVGTALSESGTLPPGNYTLSVEVDASVDYVTAPYQSDANFTFELYGPASTPTPTPIPFPVTHATNLSTRLLVGNGSYDNGIGGFIITGSDPRHLLLRGIGPSLNGPITNALSNPSLRLNSGNRGCLPPLDVTNNNWRDTQEAEIIATGRAPSNDLESAIVADLAPGAYTATLTGNGSLPGVGLVEIYDLSTNQNSRLANISTRANVGAGDNLVIAGFILGGASGEDTIIVRGLGPSLSVFFDSLPDPKLELRDSEGALIASDDNWMDDPNQAAIIQAVGLAPSSGLESAIAATLMPGPYTALLSGVNNGTGIGLVEVYDNPTIGPTPTFEAEDALLNGCYRQIDPQASNGYRVDGIDATGDSVKFFQVPHGSHLVFRYATPNNGHMSLYINGFFQTYVDFERTPGGWGYPFVDKDVATNIPEGSSVTLVCNPGDIAINLDYVRIY